MNQATCSTTNLQTQHNFRWVLCANHMEPVKGLLSRYLKRKLIEVEAKNSCNNFTNNNELAKIVDWIPKIWNHLNNFLETHSSSDATIGQYNLIISLLTNLIFFLHQVHVYFYHVRLMFQHLKFGLLIYGIIQLSLMSPKQQEKEFNCMEDVPNSLIHQIGFLKHIHGCQAQINYKICFELELKKWIIIVIYEAI